MIKKRYCARCGTEVKRGKVVSKGYDFYCPLHDEDLYRFETVKAKRTKK